MNFNDSDYDKNLLSYYYSKTLPELEKSESKYKRYAELLSKQCEDVRAKITVLYEDLKEANTLYQNSKKVCVSLKREHRRFINGENSVRFPWCPPDDDDEEETDIHECAKSARNPRKPMTEILKEQQQMLSDRKEQQQEFERTLDTLKIELQETQTRYNHVKNKLNAMTTEEWDTLYIESKGDGEYSDSGGDDDEVPP
jgi:hypothetical protein